MHIPQRRITASNRLRAPAALLAALVLAAPWARGADDGIESLRRVVAGSCQCASRQRSGLDAALRCTDGPKDFGRLKVAHRDGWDEAEAALAADLEKVIEVCIANALDVGEARERLGLAPLSEDGSPKLAWWKRVPAGELARYPTQLVRVRRAGGERLKGLVSSADADTVVLMRAKRDGGGSERIPVDAIVDAWVMMLPDD